MWELYLQSRVNLGEKERGGESALVLDGSWWTNLRDSEVERLGSRPTPRTQQNVLDFDPRRMVKMITRGRDEQREIMALATRARLDGRDRANMLCSHCKKMGHEAETCFELQGYPEWWGDRPRSDGQNGSGRGRGLMNGRRGGWSYRDNGYRGNTARANAA